MKHNRKEELIACCQSLIRNAENITAEMNKNIDLKIEITFPACDMPKITIVRKMVAEEVINVVKRTDNTEDDLK